MTPSPDTSRLTPFPAGDGALGLLTVYAHMNRDDVIEQARSVHESRNLVRGLRGEMPVPLEDLRAAAVASIGVAVSDVLVATFAVRYGHDKGRP